MKKEIEITELYIEIVKVMPSDQIDHWQSDLYVKCTPESQKIIDSYMYKDQVTIFRDQEKALWFDIPFAFKPYWDHVYNA